MPTYHVIIKIKLQNTEQQMVDQDNSVEWLNSSSTSCDKKQGNVNYFKNIKNDGLDSLNIFMSKTESIAIEMFSGIDKLWILHN